MSVLSFGSDLGDELLLAFGFSPGPPEMLIILVIALLLYGGRLPEVARSWGKTLAEFRRSLSGIQNEINDAMYSTTSQLEYQAEQDPYLDESVNETSGYDEENQDDLTSDGTTEDDPTAEGSSADDSSSDSEATEEPTSEKPQSASDSD